MGLCNWMGPFGGETLRLWDKSIRAINRLQAMHREFGVYRAVGCNSSPLQKHKHDLSLMYKHSRKVTTSAPKIFRDNRLATATPALDLGCVPQILTEQWSFSFSRPNSHLLRDRNVDILSSYQHVLCSDRDLEAPHVIRSEPCLAHVSSPDLVPKRICSIWIDYSVCKNRQDEQESTSSTPNFPTFRVFRKHRLYIVQFRSVSWV